MEKARPEWQGAVQRSGAIKRDGMTSIRIQEICKRFGGATAVDQVSLRIEAGEMFFLLGPSGCGKTTLLRILAGFIPPDRGDIYFGDERITSLPPRLRHAGMVFQTYALWPHMTVANNVAYGLHVQGLRRDEVARRVERALKLVQMEQYGERRPTQLSGGQQQRVALARALVIEPRVLLLDEPLSNLDARLRDEMREEIRRLHAETGLTMVYVTHDQKEALSLAHRLAVMEAGKLVQVGAPLEVYHRPATRFVAGFLGDSNFLAGTVRSAAGENYDVDTALGVLSGVSTNGPLTVGATVTCSIRPASLEMVDSSGSGANRLTAEVDALSFLGDVIHLRLRAMGKTPLLMTVLPHVAARVKPGDSILVAVDPKQVMLIPESPS
jgi:iron(III) transport system ATP-binding protein